MKTEKRLIFNAIKMARKSTADRYKFGAVISDGPRILCRGKNNQHKTHSLTVGFPFKKLHAELHVISLAHDCKDKTITIARVNNQGKVRLAKPCAMCMEQIIKRGFRKIIFTIDENTFESIYI